jgi:hypothetical protein
MKKLILFELIFILATTFISDNPPGWYQQNIPIGNKLITDIHFLDSLNGWVITDWGPQFDTAYVFKTSNGGVNWDFQYRYHGSFNSLQMTDYNIGYICGSTGSGKIWKTIDGGINWFIQASFGINPVNDIFFVNKDTGWGCTTDLFAPGVFKTTNGGINWQYQLTGVTAKKLFFINPDTGWAGSNEANGKLYRTTNSGANWNLQFTFNNGLVDFFFANKDTVWAIAGETTGTGIKITTNGGTNWTSQNLPSGVFWGMTPKLFFINSKMGWAGISFNKILATTNNGLNWGFQTSPIFDNFSIFFVDTLNGWAGGTGLVKTDDGGGTIIYIGIKSSSTFATAFELRQNYPNPFNPSTNISFEIKKNSKVSLKIFDIKGAEVDELIDYEKYQIGTYTINYEADEDLSSGIYFYQLTAWTEDNKEIFIDTRKMILLK